ncbi:MAG: disulfide bond formation protein B [Rhizobiales bacterium]|nr:disulfide bond formation protein B [Hyphomicrobiales bacterium]
MLNALTPRITALLLAVGSFLLIAGAWVFEYYGYLPCELCLLQRWAYYVGVPLAALIFLWNPSWIRAALVLLAVLWLASAVFGAWHSGIEWGWWEGPVTCSGGGVAVGNGLGLPDLTRTAVKCNEAALRILGLSLAGWNAVFSLLFALLALHAARAPFVPRR